MGTRRNVLAPTFSSWLNYLRFGDGFPGLFYQRYWDQVKADVCNLVRDFLEGEANIEKLNQTNIVFIPKVPNPKSISQFRPISLCNFCYKVISEVLANRLKPLLPSIISQEQSAFIGGRQIHDNIVVVHISSIRKRGPKRFMVLKLDLSKAYDRVRWSFLEKAMASVGFDDRWIKWVMQFVKSLKLSIMANGGKPVDIIPSRGLHQGETRSLLICS